MVTSLAFVYVTQYYTEHKYRPVKSIANASVTGPATNIIAGIGVGFECVAIPVCLMAAALLGSYGLGNSISGLAARRTIRHGSRYYGHALDRSLYPGDGFIRTHH